MNNERPQPADMTTLELPPDWIVPDWPAPERVRAFVTTRGGGVSEGAWGAGANGGMNLGLGSGDRGERIERNRGLLNAYLPAPPRRLALPHRTPRGEGPAGGSD